MTTDKLRIAVKAILPIWLIVKIIAAVITFLSMSEIDLTFLNPAVEFGFNSLVFIKDTSWGLAVFISFVVITMIGIPLSFLVVPDNRIMNIIGFIAYAVIILTDIVPVFIFGFKDGIFVLSLILNLLMGFVLFYYGKCFVFIRDNEKRSSADAEENKS